jgi:uncharacterized protein YjiS (DUF1127 family)
LILERFIYDSAPTRTVQHIRKNVKMTMTKEARPSSGDQPRIDEPHDWLSRLQAELDHLGASWAARRQRAQLVRELDPLGDRELCDIGLTRFDLSAIANGTFWPDGVTPAVDSPWAQSNRIR